MSTSSTSRGNESGRKMRKGTHSCIECRRRKTRCVFRPEIPSACIECFSRGASCRDQAQGGKSTEPNGRPNLKERVARLESLMGSVLSGNNKSYNDATLPVSALLAAPSVNHENAPLITLLNNVLADNESSKSPESPKPFLNGDTALDGKLGSKHSQTCKVLLSQIPSCKDRESILGSTSAWWTSWKPLFPSVAVDRGQKTLHQYVCWALDQENPISIALGLLCIVVSIQQLLPEPQGYTMDLPLPLEELMGQYLSLVDRLVISDNEYAISSQGIEVIALQARCYVNIGQPQTAWLLFRRAILIAQLIGINVHGKVLKDEKDMSIQELQIAWWTLNEIDRYLSVVLGLPHAVADDCHLVEEAAGDENISALVFYRRKLSVIAGRIIVRNKTKSNLSLSLFMTQQIDVQLDDLVNLLSEDFWDVASTCQENVLSPEDSYERLMTRFWYHQLKVLLHLPYAFPSSTNQQLDGSRLTCFESSRAMLKLYRLMRLPEGAAFYMCKIIDFQSFSAAVLLLLGLLNFEETPLVFNEQNREQDRQLVNETIRILRRASSEYGNKTAALAASVLETLSASADGHCRFEGQETGLWTGKLCAPWFGTIMISPRAVSSQSSVPNFPSSISGNTAQVSPSRGVSVLPMAPCETAGWNMVTPSPGEDGFQELDTADHETNSFLDGPRVEIDWQNIVNMDVSQDWSWFLEGTNVE